MRRDRPGTPIGRRFLVSSIDLSEFKIGDQVEINGSNEGAVVFSTVTSEFSDEFPAEEWLHMERGLMLRTKDGALVFYSAEYLGSGDAEVARSTD